MSPKILIIGGTGNIGKPITQQIVAAKSSFERIALLTSGNTLSNKTEELKTLREQGVDVLIGNITDEEQVKKAYKGINTVVCCLGRGAIDLQIDLMKWASETPDITRFFPSEYGTDIEHNERSPCEKPHQHKLKVRAYAKTIPKDKLHFTYLVTGPYSDMYIVNSADDKVSTYNVQKKLAVCLGDGNGKVAFTTMKDVGGLVVACLQHPSESQDKILIVNSFTATPNGIVAELEKQTGSKWDVSYTPLEELKRVEKEAWERGAPNATPTTLRRIWTEGGTLYDKPRDNALIGDPKMMTLADQVSEIIEKQGKL